jgi:hypothetical protein
MTELEAFGAHCRKMATAQHRPDCRSVINASTNLLSGYKPTAVPCSGCVSALDRAIWQRLADEVSAYLTTEPEETLL